MDGAEPGLTLLVWDAPNIDMALSDILRRRPVTQDRPQFDAIGRWLLGLPDRRPAEVEACIFINVPEGRAAAISPFVYLVRSLGFSVFARPKLHGTGDIDSDMLQHIGSRSAERQLVHLVVASHDRRAFQETLEQLACGSTKVTVLGFEENSGWAFGSASLDSSISKMSPAASRQRSHVRA